LPTPSRYACSIPPHWAALASHGRNGRIQECEFMADTMFTDSERAEALRLAEEAKK
jgi:hypothetical protein